jgi:multidrug efflux system outer membrane protein
VKTLISAFLTLSLLLFAGCTVGPSYQRPFVNIPGGWKDSGPSIREHQENRPKWWVIFGDTNLNQLIEETLRSNQDLKVAALRVKEARSITQIDQADFYPHIDLNPDYHRTRLSPNRSNPFPFQFAFTDDTFRIPLDMKYEIDIWGRVRHSLASAGAETQALAAAYHTIRLTLTTDLVINYFLLRSLDAETLILRHHIDSSKEFVDLAQVQYKAGILNAIDLNRAESDLAAIEADISDLSRRRAQFENSIAVLCGKNPSEFSLPESPLDILPPHIPSGRPSDILRQRPDVVEAEYRLASACEKIGVAKAEFFPKISLTGMAGFESADLGKIFDWKSRVWSLGPHISFPIFDGGKNRANFEAAKIRYDQAVAEYRQSVLVAFKDVEDALVNLRLRAKQAKAQGRSMMFDHDSTLLAATRYKQGLTPYSDVLQTGVRELQTERISVQILGQRLISSVQLIKALGGGWNPQGG